MKADCADTNQGVSCVPAKMYGHAGQRLEHAHQLLIRTLQDLLAWEVRAARVKELRVALLEQRKVLLDWLITHTIK